MITTRRAQFGSELALTYLRWPANLRLMANTIT